MEGLVFPEKYETRKDFTKMALSHEIDFMTDAMRRGQLIPRVINYGAPKRPTIHKSEGLLPPGFSL